MKTVLFVCTGNTCRSSMAQAIAENLIKEKGFSNDFKVCSAGIAAVPGMEAAENAVKALERKGVNLKGHRAKQLTEEMVRSADLVLTMTRSQKQAVLDLVPDKEGSVFTIKEYVRRFAGEERDNDKPALLAARLEEKERDFFDKYGNELQDLLEKKEQLKKKLGEIEEKIKDWHLRLHKFTGEERRELKKAEREIMEMDIEDPYGMPLEKYQECADELEELIKKFLESLKFD